MHSQSKIPLRKSRCGAAGRTHHETEVKLRVADRAALLRQLTRRAAKLTRPRVHEMNTIYDTDAGDLLRRGRMLRLRLEEPAARASGNGVRARRGRTEKAESGAWLTFKGPAREATTNELKHYKIREEHEVRVFDDGEMSSILGALGLRASFRYEKYRTTYELPGVSGLKVMVDETPIGVFVELEGERHQIDRAAELLGFSASDYINKSYGALFIETCRVKRARGGSRVEPRPASPLPDMMFGEQRRRSG